MPNLTKKSKKSSRLSKLISGLKPPKRGSSLVVETGFPTSLIDLFVKNRDRMKKKKKTQMEISKPVLLSSPPVELPLPEDCVIEGETLREGNGEVVIGGIKAVEMILKNQENNNVVDDVDVDDGFFVRSVFVQILKIFVVVLLGLSTKRLVVGITFSAFLLVFSEFVGRKYEGFCKNKNKDKDSDANVNGLVELSHREEEIQICSNRDRDEGIEGIGSVEEDPPPPDCSSGEVVEVDVIKELIEEDGIESRKDKKKGKKLIKNIVKRLKSVREKNKNKKKKGQDSEIKTDGFFPTRKDFVVEECDKEKLGQDNGEERFSVSSRKQESEILSSGELCQANAELSVSKKNVGNGSFKNSGYLIHILVVLAGLLVGRTTALAITISWCLILKFVRKLRGHVNDPASWSPSVVDSG